MKSIIILSIILGCIVLGSVAYGMTNTIITPNTISCSNGYHIQAYDGNSGSFTCSPDSSNVTIKTNNLDPRFVTSNYTYELLTQRNFTFFGVNAKEGHVIAPITAGCDYNILWTDSCAIAVVGKNASQTTIYEFDSVNKNGLALMQWEIANNKNQTYFAYEDLNGPHIDMWFDDRNGHHKIYVQSDSHPGTFILLNP